MKKQFRGHFLTELNIKELSPIAQKFANGSDNRLFFDENNDNLIYEFCNNNPCEQTLITTYKNIDEINTQYEIEYKEFE